MAFMEQLAESMAGSGGLVLILALVFSCALLLSFGIATIVNERAETRRRLLGGEEHYAAGSHGGLSQRDPLQGLGGTMERIAQFILPGGQMEPTSELRRQMVQAGFYNLRVIRVYYAARILLAAGFGVGTVMLIPLLKPDATVSSIIVLGAAVAALGFFVPTYYISRRTTKRQTAIREGFPDSLDMLLVCVESGLGIDGAIARVSREIGRAHPLVAEHFALVGNELRVGRAREAALRAMSDRVGIDEVTSLVSLLVQTDRLGTSMADALRSHAYEMRNTRMLRAEEKAYKLPVKLSAPLIFFILPALLIVILSPALLDMGRDMVPALRGAAPALQQAR
jgi:tight adherence protein C